MLQNLLRFNLIPVFCKMFHTHTVVVFVIAALIRVHDQKCVAIVVVLEPPSSKITNNNCLLRNQVQNIGWFVACTATYYLVHMWHYGRHTQHSSRKWRECWAITNDWIKRFDWMVWLATFFFGLPIYRPMRVAARALSLLKCEYI